MTKYRKKPVIIDAIQWDGTQKGIENIVDEFPDMCVFPPITPGLFFIRTLEGNHMATKGDWIIKGVAGEYYPCKPDIFEQTYEAVE